MVEEKRGISQTQTAVVVFVVILVVAIGGLFLYTRMGTGKVSYETYTSENYDFSFSYPSNWTLSKRKMPAFYPTEMIILVRENVTKTGVNAQVRISVGKLGISSLENLVNQFEEGIENDENVTLVKGPKEIETNNVPGIDLTMKARTSAGSFRVRRLIFNGDNNDYDIFYTVTENFYDKFGTNAEEILESFTLS